MCIRDRVRMVHLVNSLGYAHLDIKLENIMIDKEGKLKLIDFGFTKELVGENGDGKMISWVGTKTYKSPEIHEQKPFSGFSADIFALGVVLFALVGKLFPFGMATSSDPHYAMLAGGCYDKYWKYINTNLGKPVFSTNLQNLLNGLFSYNPISRITIPEILEHPWIAKTPKPSPETVQALMKKACNISQSSINLFYQFLMNT
eukprot:TRINITY_DN3472_c0_g1_i2.p1 TRINITY_DN3472_c0_g1~~TRINITY_DN3472_c0_g1_i2.p1  ORF type:complete len:213 (+),score=15.76 TRINITY_DN3472_c0_g1_i2:36-641(+)